MFFFPFRSAGKECQPKLLGEAESFTYLFSFLLIELNEVHQSAVIKVNANGCIRMVCRHCVNAKIHGEQLTICGVS